MLVGIKDLKQINERLGREHGDVVIRRVGAMTTGFAAQKIAGIELVAKMPGREFLLIIGGEHSTKQLESLSRINELAVEGAGETPKAENSVGEAAADSPAASADKPSENTSSRSEKQRPSHNAASDETRPGE